jgi:cyclic-di-GMP phosphodiesterase TipF (flagellum assembly factor)
MRRRDESKSSTAPATAGPPAGEAAAKPEPVEQAKRRRAPRDGLVLASIAIVSAAIGVMLYTQFGLSMVASLVAGVSAWILFMLMHKQVQKSAQIAELKAELARARVQNAKPRVAPSRGMQMAPATGGMKAGSEIRQPDTLSGTKSGAPTEAPATRGAPANPIGPAPRAAAANADTLMGTPVRGAAAPSRPAAPKAEKYNEADSSAAASMDLSAMRLPPNGAGTAHGAPAGSREERPQQRSEVVRDQWSFRPRADSQLAATMPAAERPAATTVEGDLELVQRKIRELADEVNFVEASRSAKPVRADMRSTPTTDAIEHSIGALKAAASTMRERPNLGDFIPKLPTSMASEKKAPDLKPDLKASEPKLPDLGELVIPATAERIAGSDQNVQKSQDAGPRLDLPFPELPTLDLSLGSASPGTLPPRGKEIVRAIESRAMDVFLAPIVTLAEHTVGHYEMTATLKSADGSRIDAREEDFTLVGREHGASFDIERLHRAAALSLRMEARDKDGTLLTGVLGSSLSSRPFLEAIAQVYEARPKIASQLVVTLTQRAIDDFTPGVWQALRDMHAFGFRFALDKIEHMRTDFAALAVAGFRFLRLEPQMLFDGFSVPDRFVPAEEIHQRARLANLAIIGNGITDAKTQKRLLEAGVDLGQGPLFGAARQVMLDTAANHSAAA